MNPPTSEPPYLLLLEPNPDARLALTDFLEAEGYCVKPAGTGEEALYALDEDLPYAGALIDLDLPDMEWTSLLERLIHIDPHIPVIVITGLTEVDQTLRTFHHNIHAFLRKPYNREEVLAVVAHAVEVRRTAQKVEVMENTLQLTEERYQLVIQAAKDAIIVADGQGDIVECNEAAEGMFGYQADEIIGRSLTVLMPERYRPTHLRGLEHFRTTGQAPLLAKTLEVHGQKKIDLKFPLNFLYPLCSRRGNLCFAGSFGIELPVLEMNGNFLNGNVYRS